MGKPDNSKSWKGFRGYLIQTASKNSFPSVRLVSLLLLKRFTDRTDFAGTSNHWSELKNG